jgi:hypothetical protein
MQSNQVVIFVMGCYNSCCESVILFVIPAAAYNNKILSGTLVCGCIPRKSHK